MCATIGYKTGFYSLAHQQRNSDAIFATFSPSVPKYSSSQALDTPFLFCLNLPISTKITDIEAILQFDPISVKQKCDYGILNNTTSLTNKRKNTTAKSIPLHVSHYLTVCISYGVTVILHMILYQWCKGMTACGNHSSYLAHWMQFASRGHYVRNLHWDCAGESPPWHWSAQGLSCIQCFARDTQCMDYGILTGRMDCLHGLKSMDCIGMC